MTPLKKSMALALAAMAIGCAAYAQQQPQPKTVAGKVVAVSHEKVQVNNQWLDQIKVKVDSCNAHNLEEVVYTSATVSDRAWLGQLFDADFHQAQAMTMETPQQRQINGYGLFWVDAANHVQRTGVLGADMDCNRVPQLIQQFQ